MDVSVNAPPPADTLLQHRPQRVCWRWAPAPQRHIQLKRDAACSFGIVLIEGDAIKTSTRHTQPAPATQAVHCFRARSRRTRRSYSHCWRRQPPLHQRSMPGSCRHVSPCSPKLHAGSGLCNSCRLRLRCRLQLAPPPHSAVARTSMLSICTCRESGQMHEGCLLACTGGRPYSIWCAPHCRQPSSKPLCSHCRLAGWLAGRQ